MSRPRILVVDDEPGMLRAIERVLAPLYETHMARLPSQALAAAAEGSFQIALLDVRMPEMDGFELMARLVAAQPTLDVILMTGSTDERDVRLARAIREKAFFFLTKPFDRAVLLTLVERCLELHRLDAENRSHVLRLERELQASRVFQQSLLPERAVARGGWDIALHYEPYGELCGDFCDYVLDGAGPCAAIVVDVAGHGAPAAMLTGMIKQVFHGASDRGFAPRAILERIVAAGKLLSYDRHLTAICARVDPGTNTLEYVNAGHPSGVVARPDGSTARLESTAPLILAELPQWTCEERSVPFGAGDTLLLYTDGLIEAENGKGEEFGIERLEPAIGALAAGVGRTASACPKLIAALRRNLAGFSGERPLEDDLTMLLVRRTK